MKLRPTRKSNTTGYRGISKNKTKETNPYQARLYFAKKGKTINIYIGDYETAELAYIARCRFLDSMK